MGAEALNGKIWKPEHTDTLRRMNAAGYTDAEIAAVTGHCVRTVRDQRNARGLASVHRRDWFERLRPTWRAQAA
jgi:hypothetical protein